MNKTPKTALREALEGIFGLWGGCVLCFILALIGLHMGSPVVGTFWFAIAAWAAKVAWERMDD